MCVRGASALEEVLREHAGDPLSVLVVWEPVIVTDLGPPATQTLARVSDPRAVQYWDRGRVLSREIVEAARKQTSLLGGPPEDEDMIVWDWVAVFPPGATWSQAAFPTPSFHGYPVLAEIDRLREALGAARGRSGA